MRLDGCRFTTVPLAGRSPSDSSHLIQYPGRLSRRQRALYIAVTSSGYPKAWKGKASGRHRHVARMQFDLRAGVS